MIANLASRQVLHIQSYWKKASEYIFCQELQGLEEKQDVISCKSSNFSILCHKIQGQNHHGSE